MLTLTRKEGESLYLTLAEGVDPKTPVGEILGSGGIVFRIFRVRTNSATVGVEAPDEVMVLREELRY